MTTSDMRLSTPPTPSGYYGERQKDSFVGKYNFLLWVKRDAIPPPLR